MAGLDHLIADDLRRLIFYFLDNELVANALFIAERLTVYEPSADSAHLSSLCLLRLGRLSEAADQSERYGKSGQHLGCAYVFAQCCLGLGQCRDGIQALEQCRSSWVEVNSWGKHSESNRQILPNAASIYCLLGKLFEGCDDVKSAVECYSNGLKLNAFMWDAFTRLCDIGVAINTSNIFKVSPNLLVPTSEPFCSRSYDSENSGYPLQAENRPSQTRFVGLPNADPFGTSTRHNLQVSQPSRRVLRPAQIARDTTSKSKGKKRIATVAKRIRAPEVSSEVETQILRGSGTQTPEYTLPSVASLATRSRASRTEPSSIRSERRTFVQGGDAQYTTKAESSVSIPDEHQYPTIVAGHKRTPSGRLIQNQTQEFVRDQVGARKSVRQMNRTYAVRTPDPKTGRTERERGVPTNSKVKNPATNKAPTTTLLGDRKRRQALESLLSLFKQLGESYYLSTHHQTPLALHILTSLPITHQQTPYVLSHTALAHFELADYTTAALTFSTLRKHSPHQTQHMDIYSTCLWHLRRPIDLTLLSYELSELSRHTPETWCAIGNSFSLDRDHSNAGKCFKRATQLNPKFAYGYTLEGHEYIAHEEFELAIQAFRKAVVVRKRHYNAWYGLGIAFLRLGKFACAEAYFRRAARIKPRCEVLVGGVGMALEAQRNFPAALNHYTAAANLAPKSIAPRERKVRLLLQMNDIKAAASELEVLRGLAPQRGFVYVLLGRMYALDGDKEMAVRSFGRAMGLCPERGKAITEEMAALIEGIEDEDSDVEML